MRFARPEIALRATAQVWLWRHGWVWPIALLATAAVLALRWTVIQPQRAHMATIELALQQERVSATQRRASVDAAATDAPSATDVRVVIAAAPGIDGVMARMVELAQSEGIALPQGDYQQHLASDVGLLEVNIVQPVHAAYPQLRRYIEAVLRSVPNIALEQLTARRENVGQSLPETRLRWSLWLPAPGIAPGHGPAVPGVSLQTIPRERFIATATTNPARDLFAARSWTPPPPPPPKPTMPPAPVPPPIPFTYLGKKLEGAAWEVYLARGEQTLIVRAGAVIDGTYRIDRVDPPLLAMTYLPLGQSQTLPIGGAP